jgi:hypothetical protein
MWTYSGINQTTGLPLNLTTDLMSVDASSGKITVKFDKPEGAYRVKVVGTLPDMKTT